MSDSAKAIIIYIAVMSFFILLASINSKKTESHNKSTTETPSHKTRSTTKSFVLKTSNNELIKEIDKLTERGLNSEKISTVKNNFESLRILQSLHASTASSYTQRYMEKSISEIKGYLSALLIGKWEETARKRLENFEMAYSSFLESDFPDLATATRAKNSCLHHYDSFWDAKRSFENEYGHCLQNYDVWEYARQEMTELLRCYDRNFVFWDSPNYNNGNTVRKQLEIKLTKKVDTHRPEYKRKTAIYKELLSIVEKEAPLYRSQLLKMVENYDPKEVAAAYRYLVKKSKLFEYKIGNRLFVDLSEKERNQYSQPAKPPSQSPLQSTEDVSSSFPSVEDFLQMLDQQKIPYIDKRSVGGCLWIKTGINDIALSKATVVGKKLCKANSTRHFDGESGWFIK